MVPDDWWQKKRQTHLWLSAGVNLIEELKKKSAILS